MGKKGLNTYYRTKEIEIENKANEMKKFGKNDYEINKFKKQEHNNIKLEKEKDFKGARGTLEYNIPEVIKEKYLNDKCFCGEEKPNYIIIIGKDKIKLCYNCYLKYNNTTIKQLKEYQKWLKEIIK